MKRNYSKLISVTLILVVMLAVFAFPTPVYAGDQAPVAEQSAYAVFQNNSGAVGTQIGSDTSAVTVTTGQNVFVCIQMDFSIIMKKHGMIGQWRTWGGSWTSMAAIGAGSSTDWEYWNSNYTDHTSNEVSDHFGDTAAGNYIFESDFTAFAGNYPESQVADLHETWFVIQAPSTAARYEIRWYDSEEPYAPTPTNMVDITVAAPPTVSTQAASSIGDNSATLNGNITDTGTSNVTERGFDWGFTDSYGSSWTETPGPYGTGTYNHGISGLDSATTYHFRAKAYNSYGWTYGADTEFTTTGLPTKPYVRVVQGSPRKGSATWWEWIVVNPTDSTITVTEVRVVDDAATDWGWTADNTQGYPTSGWTDGGVNGYYWSGSETVPAYSAKVFRSRPVQANATDSTSHTMTWSLTVTGYSPAQRQTQVW